MEFDKKKLRLLKGAIEFNKRLNDMRQFNEYKFSKKFIELAFQNGYITEKEKKMLYNNGFIINKRKLKEYNF